MDSYLSTGQKGLAFLASSTPGAWKKGEPTNTHNFLRVMQAALPDGSAGVGVTAAALNFAEQYAKGTSAADNIKVSGIRAAQAFCAVNASRMLERKLTGWRVTGRFSEGTIGGLSSMLVLLIYDLRTYVLKRHMPRQSNYTVHSLNERLRNHASSSAALFALMLWPRGEAVVRACMSCYMLRAACSAAARLLYGDKGYETLSFLFKEIEGSIHGFLMFVSLPLFFLALYAVGLAWVAFSGVVGGVVQGLRVGACSMKRVLVGVWSGVWGLLSRRRNDEG